jgi:polar amino acid transport system substrate-binding protein
MLGVADYQAAVASIIGGRVDALVAGQFSLPDPDQRGVEVIVDKQSPVYGSAVAFRKEDKTFRDEFNKQMVPLLRNGTWVTLFEKYKIPNGPVIAELISHYNSATDVEPSCE